jgi:CBS domain-containing protein
MPKTVRDIVVDRKQIYWISNQATIAEAARYLKEHGIRSAGVCSLSGKVVGVLSQSDISDKVAAENYRPSEVKVQAVATTTLVKVTPDATCQEAARLMNSKGIYHLIVEEADGTFLGMISLRDCTHARAEDERERAEMYQEYAFPRY